LKIFCFDPGVGRTIDKFGSSNFVLSEIVRLTSEAQISCFHLGPGGRVGHHQAVSPQLLLVVQGDGWARSGSGDPTHIKVGDAVYWNKDEWHETSTNSGMIAIVIESESIHPGESMPPAE
jgi:quercetin dioxygenase-like cupin family protein